MDKLTQLADKYGADKSPNIKHNYTPFYFNLFENDRNQVHKVLEIGAGEGASLRMWREFFPNAQIYGGDNQDNRIFEDTRIRVIKCDQSVRYDLMNLIRETGQDIDIFIDDGSHNPEHQLFTCLVVMPMLPQNATYVIEDVDDASAEGIKQKLIDNNYDVEMTKFGKRHDDRVIVVKHKHG